MKVFSNEFGLERNWRSRCVPHPYRITPHLHQHVELLLVTGGEVIFTVNGVRTVLGEGQMGIAMPFSTHSIVTAMEGACFWLTVFSISTVSALSSERELLSQRSSAAFTPSEGLVHYLTSVIDIHNRSAVHIVGDIPYTVSAVLYAILAEYATVTAPASSAPQSTALSRLILYVTENCKDHISMRSAGRALGYNPKYLSQLLSDLPDMSFYTLLHSCRADLARSLLLATDMKIIDIAYECGYNDERSFRRAFRSVANTSPSEYRKRMRAKRGTAAQ